MASDPLQMFMDESEFEPGTFDPAEFAKGIGEISVATPLLLFYSECLFAPTLLK